MFTKKITTIDMNICKLSYAKFVGLYKFDIHSQSYKYKKNATLIKSFIVYLPQRIYSYKTFVFLKLFTTIQ